MDTIIRFIVLLIRALMPVVANNMKDSSEDAMRRPELRERLKSRIRSTWGRRAGLCIIILSLVALSGCGTRVVYLPSGEPVRLASPIPNADVWVMGEDGKAVRSRMTLPEGWYAIDDPDCEPYEIAKATKDKNNDAQAVCKDGKCPVAPGEK